MGKENKITDLKSLRAARIELETEVLTREVELITNFQHFKDNLFNFSSLRSFASNVAKSLLFDKKIGVLTTAIGGLILSKSIGRTNKWLDRISTATIGFMSNKWGTLIWEKISAILKK